MKKKWFLLCLTLILAIAYSLPLKVSANKTNLTDIEGHWAEDNIRGLVEKGIISGYPDGTFRPDKEITRAEFVSLLVKAFHLKSNDPNAEDQVFYKDTITFNSKGFYTWMHWALPEIHIAAIRGIINGTGEDTFSPNEPLTREQLAVIMDNFIYEDAPFVLQELSQLALPAIYVVEQFHDASSVSRWAAVKVNRMVVLGMMAGNQDGTFAPKKAATRAEVAAILTRLLEKTSNQDVDIMSARFIEDLPESIPAEIKEWANAWNGEEEFIWNEEDGVYVAVKRGGSSCRGLDLKSIDKTMEKTTVTFEYNYPVKPMVCNLMVVTNVMVVKIPPTEEVEVVILK